MEDGVDPKNSIVPVPGVNIPESDQFPPTFSVPEPVKVSEWPLLIVKSPVITAWEGPVMVMDLQSDPSVRFPVNWGQFGTGEETTTSVVLPGTSQLSQFVRIV